MRNQTKKEFLIQEAKKVISEYDIRLTLRQIYYRLVAKQLIENAVTNYKSLSKALVEARLSGEIPFSDMTDMTRRAITDVTRHYEGQIYIEEEFAPEKIIEGTEYFGSSLNYLKNNDKEFKLPRWNNQPIHTEIWLEKQALEGLFRTITDDKEVVLGTCRGYPSWDFLYSAAVRLKRIDKSIRIYYFGDFDPSGKDIYRFVQSAFRTFGISADFELVAITLKQIEEYDIPHAPTKTTDSRSANHVARYGDIAVELDAVEPKILLQLIEGVIDNSFDTKTYDKSSKEQKKQQEEIKKLIEKTLK